jgi:hypothetical protein
MTENGTSGDLRKQITDWLDHVLEGIKANLIESEQELEDKVRIIPSSQRARVQFNAGGSLYPTLFEHLGYIAETCEDHPVVMVVMAGRKPIKTIPDYIVKSTDGKDLAIWELKVPRENVDIDESTLQVMSYCNSPKRPIPLGVLFNGRQLRIFINPDHPGLAKYRKISDEPKEARRFDFRCSPVLSMDFEEPNQASSGRHKQAVEVLSNFSCSKLSGKAVSLARTLAEKKLKEVENGKRVRETVECLREALRSPSDEVIAAIAGAIRDWKGLDPQPQPEDAVIAWHKRRDNILVQDMEAATTKAKHRQHSSPESCRPL